MSTNLLKYKQDTINPQSGDVSYAAQEHSLRHLLTINPRIGRDRAHRELTGLYGREAVMSPSGVRDRLQTLKRSQKESNPEAEQPWRRFDELERGGDYTYLCELDLASSVLLERGLTALEAQCAKSLREGIENLDRGAAVVLVAEYAHRSDTQHRFPDAEVDTGDLDRLLIIQPWSREGAELHRSFVKNGMASRPDLGSLKHLLDRDIPDVKYTLADWVVYKLGIGSAFAPWTVMVHGARQTAQLIVEPPLQDDSLDSLSWLGLVEKIWSAES